MILSAISIYPVKGCRGLMVHRAMVDSLGLVGDRRFMVVGEDGVPVTQRSHVQLALVETQLSEDNLQLSSAGFSPIEISLHDQSAPIRTVEVWESKGLQAEDCGDPANQWVSDFLGGNYRLVRIGDAFRRPTKDTLDLVSFADAYPLLVVSEASLADLNTRLERSGSPALPIDRFRPNLVISGCEAFAEDRWTRVKVGDVTFRAAGPCARCIVTTTNQQTGVRAKEPLRTLATYRRDPAEPTAVNFGQNLINEDKAGILTTGNPVECCD